MAKSVGDRQVDLRSCKHFVNQCFQLLAVDPIDLLTCYNINASQQVRRTLFGSGYAYFHWPTSNADLRHSFASHAAARSETLPMIAKLLGHARPQTTSRYAHLDDGPVLDAAERIGALIADAMGEGRSLNYNTMCDIGVPIHDR